MHTAASLSDSRYGDVQTSQYFKFAVSRIAGVDAHTSAPGCMHNWPRVSPSLEAQEWDWTKLKPELIRMQAWHRIHVCGALAS